MQNYIIFQYGIKKVFSEKVCYQTTALSLAIKIFHPTGSALSLAFLKSIVYFLLRVLYIFIPQNFMSYFVSSVYVFRAKVFTGS